MKRWIWVLLVAAACSKDKGGTGKERGPCYGNKTCDTGLVCLSEICVRPPGADCAKVGEKLASYRMGNYAPKEERDKVVGELTAQCTKEQLTADEGECILDATTRYDVASCPRPLLAELSGDKTGCGAAGDNLVRLLVTEMAGSDPKTRAAVDKVSPEVASAIAESCEKDLWPEVSKKCVATATTTDALDDCRKTFPEGLEERIEKRLEPALEKLMKAMTESMGGGGAAPATTPELPPPPTTEAQPPKVTPPTETSLIEACKGYVEAVEKYTKCTKVPESARQTATQSLDAMTKGFAAQPNPGPEAIGAAKQACELSAAALADNMKQFGCP